MEKITEKEYARVYISDIREARETRNIAQPNIKLMGFVRILKVTLPIQLILIIVGILVTAYGK